MYLYRAKHRLLVILLLVSLLACNLVVSTPTVDETATRVAATLTALAVEAGAAAAPTTPSSPTSVPITAPPASTTPAPARPARLVVYVQAGDVWLWTPDSGTTRLTFVGDVERLWLAPDGSRVAFTRRPTYEREELWQIPVAGGTPQRLRSADELRSIEPGAARGVGLARVAWVPGTHLLAFSTLAIPEPPPSNSEAPAPAYHHNLWVMDTDALTARSLLAPGEGGFFFFAPSGRRVAVSSYTQLMVMNTDGSGRRVLLTYPFLEGPYGYNFYAEPVWSPDESVLMMAIPDAAELPAEEANLVRVPLDGGGETVVGRVPYSGFMGIDPSLTQVAYRAWSFSDRRNELHVTHLTSGDVVYATGMDMYVFAWAPEPGSGRFAYEQDGAVFVGKVGASPLEVYRYGAGKRLGTIRWLDASAFLLSLRDESSGRYELHLVQLDGAPRVVLVGYPDGNWFDGY